MTVRHDFSYSRAGFSLIELVIGMAVVGMILGGALLLGGKLWEIDRRNEVREQLQDKKAAILNFARKNGRFPMMDVTNYAAAASGGGGDGYENIISGQYYQSANSYNINYPFGLYPYNNLNDKRSDSFSMPTQYFVNWQLARTETALGRPCKALKNLFQGKIITSGTIPGVVSVGLYNYRDQLKWDSSNPAATPNPAAWFPLLQLPTLKTPVAAVLVSAGQDRIFNPPNDQGYLIREFALKAQTSTFDDIVEYITLSEAYSALNCQ